MIKVLDKHIADKIAAGEVVDRPVSVVKELVENSIDARATEITIELRDGGKEYLRVSDNGIGIPSDQVATAFLRHATSKIQNVDDLDCIETLGFRGEALASISAVSRLEITTRSKEEKIGSQLVIHGGITCKEAVIGCPVGTTIIIEDLFYNTPARRKFLKNASSESAQIIQLVSQLAITKPDIRFKLINNRKNIFTTSGQGKLLETILEVYGLDEYKDLLPINFDDGNIKISGYVSKASVTRNSRRNQYVFVNGRVVKSKVVEKAIDLGFKERVFEGRYPIAFIFIELDPKALDVNIHPNKKEIRISNEQVVIDAVSKSIIDALSKKSAVSSLDQLLIDKEKQFLNLSEKEEQWGDSEVKNIITSGNENNKAENFHIIELDQTAFLKEEDGNDFLDENILLSENSILDENSGLDANNVLDENSSGCSLEKDPFEGDEHQEMVAALKAARQLTWKMELNEPVVQDGPFDFSSLTYKDTVMGTYIVAEADDTMYLIDQHAAHERVFYEKLMGLYNNRNKNTQQLLVPLTVSVEPYMEEDLGWLELFNNLGFELESFGPATYAIRGIPEFMELDEAESFVNNTIDQLETLGELENTVVIDKIITKSCKSAIKAHDYISKEEGEALLLQMKSCKNPFSCPHGRPTVISFTKYQLERMFKRV